ncbi:hypothetical protein DRE_04517 [Drechslerella stenobrocha 248]|uniref:Uncharacterized protein n=1 Tax=Drechslerella stenobrocha 248 TaxID=1043628 RepID=W7HQA7_9PEZI|nr:hypothetical protein DRE_04517 [Drechslerella stenobrocha 248]
MAHPLAAAIDISNTNLPALVAAFNSIPHTELVPSGAGANNWHFAIRHIPLPPPGDVLFLVNPASHFVHAEGPIAYPVDPQSSPTHPSSSPSPQPPTTSDGASVLNPPASASLPPQVKAEGILPLLLHSFVNRFRIADRSVPAFGPWSWSTNDAELADAVSTAMKAAGVREELCVVGVGSAAENEDAQVDWCRFVGALTKMLK